MNEIFRFKDIFLIPSVYGGIAVSCIFTSISFIKHCFASEIAPYYVAKKNGAPIDFSENMQDIILEELHTFTHLPGKDWTSDWMAVAKESLALKYRIFVGDDLTGVVLGHARIWGIIANVGLPYNIIYNTANDIGDDYDRLKVIQTPGSYFFWRKRNLKSVDWGSAAGANFVDALILSQDAKRFVIQRLLHEADVTNTLLVESAVGATPFMLAAVVNHLLFKKNRSRNIANLRPIFAATYLSAYCGYVFFANAFRNYVDLECDKTAASMGKEYAKGGVEYYEKALQRNRCVNDLSEKSIKPFTADGDFLRRVFYSVQPTGLKNRLLTVRKVLKALEDKESEESPSK